MGQARHLPETFHNAAVRHRRHCFGGMRANTGKSSLGRSANRDIKDILPESKFDVNPAFGGLKAVHLCGAEASCHQSRMKGVVGKRNGAKRDDRTHSWTRSVLVQRERSRLGPFSFALIVHEGDFEDEERLIIRGIQKLELVVSVGWCLVRASDAGGAAFEYSPRSRDHEGYLLSCEGHLNAIAFISHECAGIQTPEVMEHSMQSMMAHREGLLHASNEGEGVAECGMEIVGHGLADGVWHLDPKLVIVKLADPFPDGFVGVEAFSTLVRSSVPQKVPDEDSAARLFEDLEGLAAGDALTVFRPTLPGRFLTMNGRSSQVALDSANVDGFDFLEHPPSILVRYI